MKQQTRALTSEEIVVLIKVSQNCLVNEFQAWDWPVAVAGRGAGQSQQLLSPFQGALCCTCSPGSRSCSFCPNFCFLTWLSLSQPTSSPCQDSLHCSGPVTPCQKPRSSQDGVVWPSLSLTSLLLCYTCSLCTSLTLDIPLAQACSLLQSQIFVF